MSCVPDLPGAGLHVGAVDGQPGDRVGHLRLVHQRAQPLDLRPEGGARLAPLGLGGDLGEGAPLAGDLRVERGQRPLAGRVDEEPRGVGHELVAGRALDGPVRQLLARLQDLLHPDVRDAAVGQAAQVPRRVGEAVRMVDAQAVDEALRHQAQHEGVGGLEDLRVLLAHPGQLVDREEAPVAAGLRVDVEEPLAQRLVGPERVLVRGGHVVRDDVEQHVEPRAGQRAKGRLAAQIVRDAPRVGDVVAVRRAAPRLERGGEVEVADAQVAQVGDELPGVVEGQVRTELQAVGGPHQARRSSSTARASRATSARAGQVFAPSGAAGSAVDTTWRQRLPKRRAGSRKSTGR